MCLIEHFKNENLYVICFGNAFHIASKYCDFDFGFNYLEKAYLAETKTTTTEAPSLRKNRLISSYVNHNLLNFTFDSGEACSKMKVNLNLNEFETSINKRNKGEKTEIKTYLNPSLEVGQSIIFSCKDESLEASVFLIK